MFEFKQHDKAENSDRSSTTLICDFSQNDLAQLLFNNKKKLNNINDPHFISEQKSVESAGIGSKNFRKIKDNESLTVDESDEQVDFMEIFNQYNQLRAQKNDKNPDQNKYSQDYKQQKGISQNNFTSELIVREEENLDEDEYANKSQRFQNMSNSSQLNDSGNINSQIYKTTQDQNIQQSQRIGSSTIPNEVGSTQKLNKSKQRVSSKGSKNRMVRPSSATVHGQAGRFIQTQFSKKKLREQSGLFYSQNQLDQVQQSFQPQQTLGSSTQNLASIGSAQQMIQMVSPQTTFLNRGKIQNQIEFEYGNFLQKPVKVNQGLAFLQKKRVRPQSAGINQLQPSKILQSVTNFTYQKAKQNQNQKQFLPESFKHTDKETLYEDKIYLKKQVNDLQFENLQLKTQIQNQTNQLKKKDEMVAQVMRQMFNNSNLNVNQNTLMNFQTQDPLITQTNFSKQTNQSMNKKIKLHGNNDFLEEFKARELEHRFVSSRPTQNILRPSEMKNKNQINPQKFQAPQSQAAQKIQLLNSELANKDGQITNLKTKIRELNEYIFQKEKELSDLRKTLKFTKLKEYESELALNVQESKRLRHLLEQEMKKPKIDPVLQRNLQQQYIFQQNQIQSLQLSCDQYFSEIEKLNKKLQIQTKKFAKLKEARKSEAEKAMRLDKKALALQQRVNQLESSKVAPQRKQSQKNEDVQKFEYFQNKIEQQNQFIHNLLIRMQEEALEISPELANQMQNWQNGFEDPIIGGQELKIDGSQEALQFQNEATFFNDIVVTIVLAENSVGFEGQNFLQGKSTQLSSGQYSNFSQLKDYLRRIFEISTLEDFKIKLLVNDLNDNQDKLVMVSVENWDEVRTHAITQGQQGQQVQLLIELLGQDQIDEQPSNYEEDQFDDSEDIVLSQEIKEFKPCIEFEEVKSIFEEFQLILQIKKVKREDCLRYLLHDCRDQKTGKKLKQISLSQLIDQIESRIGFPDKDQTVKLARFLVEIVNDQGQVEILTNNQFKGQTHAEAAKIKRISLLNKLQKYIPEYQIYNGLALTSMQCRLSSIFENYREDLLQELEDQDYDDLGKASFQEIIKCMKLVGLYPDSFDQEIQQFIKFLAMRHSNSLSEVRYKQFLKAFHEDFIFIEDEKSQWENDEEPIDCYIASSDEGEYEESLNLVNQEDQQEIYSNNEISVDGTDDLEQNELLEKVDEILGQIVARLPKNNRIRSLTQVMMPNLLPIFDQEQQKNTLIITQEDFIYFILGQQSGQLGLQISERHIICLLHLLAQEDEGGYMIQNENQISSNKFIIVEEFIELIKTFIKKEQIMKQSKAMGINYEILSKESVEFLFQLRSSLMQDLRPESYSNNNRHQLNESSADDQDGGQLRDEHKQMSVPAQIREIFRKVIQEKQIAFSKNQTQQNEKAYVQVMDFDQMMDILYIKMSINCPSIKAQEELKFLLCLDLKYLEMVLLGKLDKVMQDLDYISIDLLRCAKDKSLELSRQMAVAELRKIRDKQLSNFKNLQAQTAQSNGEQQNIIGVSMSTKQEKKRKRPDDKKQIISKKSGVRQENSEVESQFRQSGQYPEFNNRAQTEAFDSTLQTNKMQTKSGQIRYSDREEVNDDLNLSRRKLAKTEGNSNAQSDQHRYREILQVNKNISEKTKLRIEASEALENISDLDEQKETSEDYLKDDDIPIDDNEMSSEQFQSIQNDMISMDHSDDNLIQNNYNSDDQSGKSDHQYDEIDKSDPTEEQYSEEVFDNFIKQSTDRLGKESENISYQNQKKTSSLSTNKVSEVRAIKDGQKARVESVSSQPTYSDHFKFNAKDSSIQSAKQFF